MATSKCVKCDGIGFESEDFSLPNGEEVVFVQCAKCGGVVGVLDQFGVADVVEANKMLLVKIAEKLGVPIDR
jgi:DnaJ-class molecular chaperone